MITKCYSVKLKYLNSISEKAYLAESFDGSTCILPKSCVLGRDNDVIKSEAYWIAAWILPKKEIQYSTKKEGFFNENGNQIPNYSIEIHKATKRGAVESNEIISLKKS